MLCICCLDNKLYNMHGMYITICRTAFFFSKMQQPPLDQGLLSTEASRSHSIRHNTVGRTPMDE